MPNSTFSPKYSRYALALLLAINMLNYIDRQILYAVFPLIKNDFHLSDTALGFLGSAFMICYMCSAPLLGWLGDRGNRVNWLPMGSPSGALPLPFPDSPPATVHSWQPVPP